ncbi:MAG TPA: hypothetical protein VJU77_11895 [Chthoniobacterales bacterium]|nr:hypothetical protein [Chthoniobacterales bacterium]
MSCLSTCSDSRKRISLCSRRIRGIRRSAFKRKAAFTLLRLAEAIVRSHANETATTTGSGSAHTKSTTTSAFGAAPLASSTTQNWVNGGAIAIGHPLGCSGARLATTLIHQMARTGASRGIASLCVGVGQGLATVFERE